MDKKPANTQNIGKWIGVVITIIGIGLIFLPAIIYGETEDWMFALGFMAICLLVPAGITVFFIYRKRAKVLAKILSGSDLLAHWKYKPQEWKTYAAKEKVTFKQEKMFLFYTLLIISGIAILITFIMSIEAGLFLIAILGGTDLLIGIIIFFQIKNLNSNNAHTGETYLGTEGVLLNNKFHCWKTWGGRLDDAGVLDEEKLLIIDYSTPNKGSRVSTRIRIPVPADKTAEAKNVVKQLARKSSSKRD